jgi:hypothetical protein
VSRTRHFLVFAVGAPLCFLRRLRVCVTRASSPPDFWSASYGPNGDPTRVAFCLSIWLPASSLEILGSPERSNANACLVALAFQPGSFFFFFVLGRCHAA